MLLECVAASGGAPTPNETGADVEMSVGSGGSGGSGAAEDAEQVTLLSTPSVSIFQVAHRPVGNSNTVLQPVAAVTGFNHPHSNPRGKNPSASAVAATTATTSSSSSFSSSSSSSITSSCSSSASSTTGVGAPRDRGNISLSQLLAQSPSADSGADASVKQPSNSGPGPGRPLRVQRRETVAAAAAAAAAAALAGDAPPSLPSGNSPLPADSSPCRVPLVKYVDLDMVSSPTRPRPGSTSGMRRQSQGSNSSSPDPHQSR